MAFMYQMKKLEFNEEKQAKNRARYVSYNTANQDLPDIYVLTQGCCMPLGIVYIYQAYPSLLSLHKCDACNMHAP